jgi:hypothetical protein
MGTHDDPANTAGILVILGVLVILVGGWGEKEFW